MPRRIESNCSAQRTRWLRAERIASVVGRDRDRQVGFARRQIWTIVFFALLGTVLGAVLLFRLVPNYSAAATLLVDTRKINISQQPAVFGANVARVVERDGQPTRDLKIEHRSRGR